MSIHPTRARLSPRQEEIRFALLAVGGGVAGAYGSVYCGHVFANALTGNLVSLASELVAGQWLRVAARGAGILLFLVGVALSVILPVRLGGDARRWQRRCLLIEAACFAVQGLLPYAALTAVSPALYLWPVFFACGMQYNTFTALHGVPVSTVFCTNNFRQMTLHALVWRRMRHTRTPDAASQATRELHISLTYLVVTATFFFGVALSVFTLEYLGIGQMAFCAVLLLVLWIWQMATRKKDA